jgi:hypothetical protein
VAATRLVVAMGVHIVQRKLMHPGIATEATSVKNQFRILEALDKCR